MTRRQLGSMRIENDVVDVTEGPLELTDRREVYRSCGGQDYLWCADNALFIAEWTAKIDDQVVAYGFLAGSEQHGPIAHVMVHPDRRGLGLGRFMARFAVDLAIRNRRRSITVEVDNEAAKAIALDLEFEPIVGEVNRMRRELKWVDSF